MLVATEEDSSVNIAWPQALATRTRRHFGCGLGAPCAMCNAPFHALLEKGIQLGAASTSSVRFQARGVASILVAELRGSGLPAFGKARYSPALVCCVRSTLVRRFCRGAGAPR